MTKSEAQAEAEKACTEFSRILRSKWKYTVSVVGKIVDKEELVFSDIAFDEVSDGGPSAKIRVSMVGLRAKDAPARVWGRVAHEIAHGYWFDEVNRISDLEDLENGARGTYPLLDAFEERACEAIEALAHELRRLCENCHTRNQS